MAEILSWRLAPVSTTESGAPRSSTRRFIFAPSLPLSVGFLPTFSPPKGAAELLESIACHLQPMPPRSLARVLDHPIHQLLKETHLRPSLEALVDDARAYPEPIAVDGLPLAGAPQHVPDGVHHGSIGSSRPAAWPRVLALVGQALLEFPPQGSGKAEVIDTLLGCVRLSQRTHLL